MQIKTITTAVALFVSLAAAVPKEGKSIPLYSKSSSFVPEHPPHIFHDLCRTSHHPFPRQK